MGKMRNEESSKPNKGIKMNTRFKTSLQNIKTPAKCEKEKMDGGGSRVARKGNVRRSFSKERKLALQQDVDKLKKRLRHEENVHRALERAFTRPLGALPRLPPYLPQYTLELLAEVAVLEEEVVRLEEQVVNFRQGLYQEAVYISSSSSSSKKHIVSGTAESVDLSPSKPVKSEQSSSEGSPNASAVKTIKNSLLRQSSMGSESNRSWFCTNGLVTGKQALNKGSCLDGKENQLHSNSTRSKQSPQKVSMPRMFVKQASNEPRSAKKQEIVTKIQPEFDVSHGKSDQSIANVGTVSEEDTTKPAKLSEDILRCLLNIFMKLVAHSAAKDPDSSSVVSRIDPSDASAGDGTNMRSSEQLEVQDPYGICAEFGERDVGRYKYLSEISASSIDLNWVSDAAHLICRLKQLLVKLESVDLRGLTHQQKLAFWINTYNSCMMNAFLEHGIPDSPHKVVGLMRKAVLNVGGHTLNALTIEHFILRLPYHSNHTHTKGGKNDEGTMRSIFGLDWPEPLVTFALSCGSWSSPAVSNRSGLDSF